MSNQRTSGGMLRPITVTPAPRSYCEARFGLRKRHAHPVTWGRVTY